MTSTVLDKLEAAGSCGSGSCGCGSAAIDMTLAATTVPEVRINGRRLHIGPGEDLETVRERAWGEVLRQEAVRQGLLTDDVGELAPTLSADQQQVIEDMLDAAVQTPEPTAEACQRYYDAHKPRFTHGQQAQLRHILFAVTPGVPVQKLAERAEAALLELTHKDAPADRFAQLAAELSNCPSGAQGGDLGWVGPQDCAPELAQFLFMQDGGLARGLQPRLVHSRYGLHIVDVQDQKPGQQALLAQVQSRIAGELTLQSRATALRQYMLLLVGQAQVHGIELEGAETPLVQ
ncbi:MAG: peptidylprolyl isomerase [Limnohabitans sp.]